METSARQMSTFFFNDNTNNNKKKTVRKKKREPIYSNRGLRDTHTKCNV